MVNVFMVEVILDVCAMVVSQGRSFCGGGSVVVVVMWGTMMMLILIGDLVTA